MADVSDSSPVISDREFVTLLISLYRNAPELWQVQSKHYLNKHRRRIAMQKIVKELRVYKPDYDEDKLKKKINIIRTNFNKENRRLERMKQSGATSDDDVLQPVLWHYNDLLFIKDQVEVVKTENNDGSEEFVTEILPNPSPRRPPTFRKKAGPPPFTPTEKFMKLATTYFKSQENEEDLQGKVWAMKLKQLDPEQRRYAVKIINDTLFEAEMGTLTRTGGCFVTSTP